VCWLERCVVMLDRLIRLWQNNPLLVPCIGVAVAVVVLVVAVVAAHGCTGAARTRSAT
jgi:hypothetical protein